MNSHIQNHHCNDEVGPTNVHYMGVHAHIINNLYELMHCHLGNTSDIGDTLDLVNVVTLHTSTMYTHMQIWN